jgi:hypothetical protein
MRPQCIGYFLTATKSKLINIVAILAGCGCIVLVLTGALPGEMEGCEEKEAVEVDYFKYCDDRCTVKAHKEVVECDIFGGTVTEDEIYTMCRDNISCDDPSASICQPRCNESNPSLCPSGSFWQPFISTSEADSCLDALEGQSCSRLGEVPTECMDSVQCDPK